MKFAFLYFDYDFNVKRIEFKRVFLINSILKLIKTNDDGVQILPNESYKNGRFNPYPYGYELSIEESEEFKKCKYCILVQGENCVADILKDNT